MASPPPRKRLRASSAPATPIDTDFVPRDQEDLHGHGVVSRERQSGRGSGEPTDGNVSSQGKSSEPASLFSLCDVLAEELSLNRMARLRRMLADKCNGVHVYVNEMNAIPTQFVIQTRLYPNFYTQEYSVDWISTLEIITSTMNQKWPSPVPSDEEEKLLCLRYIWRIFQNIAKQLTFDRKKSKWISDEDAVLGTSIATAVNNDCHRSHLPINKEQVQSEEKECRSNKPKGPQEEDLSSGQGSGDASNKTNETQVGLLRATFRKYHILNYNIQERLVSALESQMRNSCGRDMLTILLRCACAIAFGPDFENDGVFVYQVGTSNYPFEGFPVSSMSEMTNVDREDVESPVPDVTRPLALEFGGCPSPAANESGSVSPGNSSTQSFGKGYIYSDLVVACESGDSAKYLMVVEVKSSSCPPKDEGQLLRQAVGALVGQEEVYGLVISHLKGSLLKVCRDDEGSMIYCNQKRYDLLRPRRASPAFNNEHWFDMFMDMIKVLDSARENIMLG